MSQQTINVGASPNDGTGTPLRTAFQYTNSNFSELYTAVGPSGNNIVVPGTATISGDLTVDTSTLKVDSMNDRVGIGTATPFAKLHVLGTIQSQSGSTVAQIYTDGGAAYLNSVGSFPLILQTNSAERLRIDASGNVGIGVTPSLWGAGTKALELPNGAVISFAGYIGTVGTANSYYNGTNFIFKTSAAAARYDQDTGSHKWFRSTNATPTAGGTITFDQAMTLDASGRLFVGLTSSPYGTSRSYYAYDGGTVYGAGYKNVTAGNGTAMVFINSANALAGFISTTDTTVTYGSVSDYRLKESIAPLSGGLARVNALKPSTYKWKTDGSNGEGFIAHELAEVVPSAVIGGKDELNENGSIKAQGVDLSKVVPILVAAIQELTAEVNALKNA